MILQDFTQEEIARLGYWLAHNNNGLVTGSVMLMELGIQLGRPIGDIDIVVDCDKDTHDIIVPPFCKDFQTEFEDDYPILFRTFFGCLKIEFLLSEDMISMHSELTHVRKRTVLRRSRRSIIEDLLSNPFEEYECYTQEEIIKKYSDVLYIPTPTCDLEKLCSINSLIDAKKKYITEDSNPAYIAKTQADLDLIKKFQDEHLNLDNIKIV